MHHAGGLMNHRIQTALIGVLAGFLTFIICALQYEDVGTSSKTDCTCSPQIVQQAKPRSAIKVPLNFQQDSSLNPPIHFASSPKTDPLEVPVQDYTISPEVNIKLTKHSLPHHHHHYDLNEKNQRWELVVEAQTSENGKKGKFLDLKEKHSAMSMTNLSLLEDIRRNWLKPPPSPDKSDNVNGTKILKQNPHYDSAAITKMHQVIRNIFRNKTNGFFIESGAFNGVDLSNTLFLEQELNWTGLLIEADPKYYEKLFATDRNAWKINACLGTKQYPEKMSMTRIKDKDALTTLTDVASLTFKANKQAESFEAQCFPFFSIVFALGVQFNIDYWSVDIEQAELPVFQTIPWDHVYIKMISVELWPNQAKVVTDFLQSKGYKALQDFEGHYIHDCLYVHESILD